MMTASVDLAYQQGFDQGFVDGKIHKPLKPRPVFLKSLVSNKYITQYIKGYKYGHYAGVREARTQELKRIRQAERNKDNVERER